MPNIAFRSTADLAMSGLNWPTGSLRRAALSESSSGSDAFALKLKAELKGDKYILNGRSCDYLFLSLGSRHKHDPMKMSAQIGISRAGVNRFP